MHTFLLLKEALFAEREICGYFFVCLSFTYIFQFVFGPLATRLGLKHRIGVFFIHPVSLCTTFQVAANIKYLTRMIEGFLIVTF